MSIPMTIDAPFWDRIAPKYAKKPVPDEDAYRQTLDRVRARLTLEDRVLEVGCGTGSTALRLAPNAGHILATDVSRGMIAIAEQKANAGGVENVEFRTGTLEDPKLDQEHFDVVMAFNLIHLLRDIPQAVARVRQLVKPGGLFISKTPCVGEMGAFARAAVHVLRAFGRAPFVNFVKKASLEATIAQGGFEILETGLYPEKSHSLYIVARKKSDI